MLIVCEGLDGGMTNDEADHPARGNAWLPTDDDVGSLHTWSVPRQLSDTLFFGLLREGVWIVGEWPRWLAVGGHSPRMCQPC